MTPDPCSLSPVQVKAVVDPLFWFWLGLIVAGVVTFRKKRRAWSSILLVSAAAMSAVEAAKLPARLLAQLERPYLLPSASAPDHIPPSDAVIVLGGYMDPFTNSYLGFELDFAVDRLMTGVALIRDGKGLVLVLGGGSNGDPPQAVEAEAAAHWIETWHLVSVPVESLGVNKTTYDEARHAAALAQKRGWKTVTLVTSAWHMRRAVATFRKAGLDVVPVGCDFVGTSALDDPISFVPRTSSLVNLRLWLEETVGYAFYRIRGRA